MSARGWLWSVGAAAVAAILLAMCSAGDVEARPDVGALPEHSTSTTVACERLTLVYLRMFYEGGVAELHGPNTQKIVAALWREMGVGGSPPKADTVLIAPNLDGRIGVRPFVAGRGGDYLSVTTRAWHRVMRRENGPAPPD